MIRMNFTLTSAHRDKLREEAKRQEVQVSELLRKVIDYYFNRKGK